MSTTTEPSTERLFGGYSGRMLGVISMGTTMAMAARLALSPLLPHIIGDLGITTAQAGMALTLMWALVALAQYPGGRLSDDLTRKTVLVISMVLVSVGVALLLFASTFPRFLVAVCMLGIGAGLYPPAAFAQLSDLYVERRGQAFGLNAAAFDLGGVVAAILALIAITVATWQAVFLPVLVGLLVVLGLTHQWNRESYATGYVPLEIGSTGRRIVGTRELRRILLAFSLYNFVWQGSINFLPTFLQAQKGVDAFIASNAFAALFIIGVLVKPAAGVFGDRYGEIQVSIWSLVIGMVGLLLLVYANSLEFVVLGVGIFAIGLGAYFPVMTTHLMNALSKSTAGGDLGGARTILFGVGSFGSAYVGLVASALDYTVAFGGFIVVLAFSTIISYTLQ